MCHFCAVFFLSLSFGFQAELNTYFLNHFIVYLTLPDARMVFDFAYISPLLTFFAQSVNLLIVNVGLSQCRAIAWNIDKKHRVNPLTPGRQADRLCNRPARLNEDNRGWERGGRAAAEINGVLEAHWNSAALHFSPRGRIRVDLQ